MRTDEFDYYLPEELIAQTPLENRSSSRLLVLHKKTGQIEHRKFSDIINYLSKGDALVINDTKVIPARLIGEKEDTKAVIELLLLKNTEGDNWECLARPAKRLHVGTIVSFGNGSLKAEIIEKKDEGIVCAKLLYEGILMEVLEALGTMPLPPYIHEKLDPAEYIPASKYDREEMYQELKGIVDTIGEPHLKKLAQKYFVDDAEFIKEFKQHSAAKSVHHGFVGGLLQHTLAVTKMCEFFAANYPVIDRDLLITAA